MSDICGICREELISNIKVLECKHSFHEECINSWIERYPSCPFCRKLIVSNIISWETFNYTVPVSVDFLRVYSRNINWTTLIQCQVLPLNILREFEDMIDWNTFFTVYNVPEHILLEFICHTN